MTAFPMRFAPSAQVVRKMLKNGELGEILGINGINHSEIPGNHRAWFTDKKLAGGGAVMDHTVHLADLFRWYFEAEALEVYAELGNLFCRNEVEVETAGLAECRYFANTGGTPMILFARPRRHARRRAQGIIGVSPVFPISANVDNQKPEGRPSCILRTEHPVPSGFNVGGDCLGQLLDLATQPPPG
jgi:predicted dehydrogenase